LLWGSIVRDAPVINYLDIAFLLSDLPGSRGYLGIARGATWALIVFLLSAVVTDLQGPPSERMPEQKLWDFKTRAQQYARDRESCDDVRISYLEFLETEAEDDLALARMIAG
jgi:hypothetical protein